MFGAAVTAKLMPLLGRPSTVTTTFPVVAPVGTFTPMELALQKYGVAVVVLNLTVLDPCVSKKFEPEIEIDAPTEPEVWDKLPMLGAGSSVKLTPLLATVETVTTTFPVVAPVGTGTVILLAPHAVGAAVVPLKVTVLDPCGEPNPVPAIVTEVPTMPLLGERLVIAGPGCTVKLTPFVDVPLTVTTTLPVVAPIGG